MPQLLRTGFSRCVGAVLAALFVAIVLAGPVSAATTGTISGTVTDAATKKPLAGVTVTASSPSGRGTSTSDASGFYNIYNLAPDTYTVSITIKGYDDVVTSGVTVVQDQNVRIDQTLARSLKTIGRVSARNASNLVQTNQTADVYNVSPQQPGAVWITSYSERCPPTPTAAPSCCGETLYTSAVWFVCTRLLALRADTRPIVLSERASV